MGVLCVKDIEGFNDFYLAEYIKMHQKMKKCTYIKELLPLFLDNALQNVENKRVKEHLSSCVSCEKEVVLYQQSWKILEMAENIEPQAGYMSRFWTEVSGRKTRSETIYEFVKNLVWQKKLVPVFATVCVLLIVGMFSIRNYYHLSDSQTMLASLSSSDLEMVEYVELAENLEIIENIDFYEDMDLLESIDLSQLS